MFYMLLCYFPKCFFILSYFFFISLSFPRTDGQFYVMCISLSFFPRPSLCFFVFPTSYLLSGYSVGTLHTISFIQRNWISLQYRRSRHRSMQCMLRAGQVKSHQSTSSAGNDWVSYWMSNKTWLTARRRFDHVNSNSICHPLPRFLSDQRKMLFSPCSCQSARDQATFWSVQKKRKQ